MDFIPNQHLMFHDLKIILRKLKCMKFKDNLNKVTNISLFIK